MIGALDTLDNLKKGGRIGGAQALLGSLLSIKPLLDISSGEVEEAGRAQTRRKALEWLRDGIFERPAVEHLCVAHGMAPDLEQMLALLAPRYGPDQIRHPDRPDDRHPRWSLRDGIDMGRPRMIGVASRNLTSRPG